MIYIIFYCIFYKKVDIKLKLCYNLVALKFMYPNKHYLNRKEETIYYAYIGN